MADPDVINIDDLYEALNARRDQRHLTWAEVATEMGVSSSLLSRLATQRSLSLTGYALCCRWLGISLDSFAPKREGVSLPIEQDVLCLLRRHRVPRAYRPVLVALIMALSGNATPPSRDTTCESTPPPRSEQ